MGTQTSVNNSSNNFHHLLCAEPWPECCGGDKSTQDTALPTRNLLKRGKLGGGWGEMTNTHKMLSQGYTDERSLQSAEWREPTLVPDPAVFEMGSKPWNAGRTPAGDGQGHFNAAETNLTKQEIERCVKGTVTWCVMVIISHVIAVLTNFVCKRPTQLSSNFQTFPKRSVKPEVINSDSYGKATKDSMFHI